MLDADGCGWWFFGNGISMPRRIGARDKGMPARLQSCRLQRSDRRERLS
jgi:hypothetical protein